MQTTLEIINLSKIYNDKEAVKNISFKISENEMVGILGPNGCGKTTTIGMILGLLKPSSGKVLINGNEIETNRVKLLENLNFISPYIELPKKLTVKQNLEIYGRLYGIKNLKERIKELSETKYHEIDKLTTPDITFLFLGIDDALNVGLKYDKDLLTFATKKQIALISPSQLHISIKMVENLWRIDGQKESVFMVYEEAQKLVEKLNGFMTVMESLENSINQTQKKFNDAKNKLVDGTGSITSRVKKLIALGDKEINKKDD